MSSILPCHQEEDSRRPTSLGEVKVCGCGDEEDEGNGRSGEAERHEEQVSAEEGGDRAHNEGEGQREYNPRHEVVRVRAPHAGTVCQRKHRHEGDCPQQEEDPCVVLHCYLHMPSKR